MMIKTKGMHCSSCEMLLKDSLEELGAKVISISHKTGEVVVEYDNEEAVVDVIKNEGYDVK